MKKASTTIYIFLRMGMFVLLLALLLGVFGIAFKYVSNGQRNFYVTYCNEMIIGEKKGVELPKDSISIFYCNTLTGQTIDYDVQIYLNVSNIENADYSVDGSRKDFKSDLTDYDCSELFSITKFSTYFMLVVPNGLTLEKIIQAKYPDKSILYVPAVNLDTKDSFILTITDRVEQMKTQIYFC